MRFLRPKYLPLIRAGTTCEIEADQATLVMLFAMVAMTSRMEKTASPAGLENWRENPTKNHGTALRMKPHFMIARREKRRSRARLKSGWAQLHRCGRAARKPMAQDPQWSKAVAYARRNGRLGIVRFNI